MNVLPVPPNSTPALEGPQLSRPYWLWLSWLSTAAPGQVRYGTHAERTVPTTRGYLKTDSLPPGVVFFETDRLAFYQWRSPVWVWVGGQMTGTVVSVDQRPADLGTNDAGFQFYGSDTFTVYLWSGSAWAAFRELGSMWANTHATRSSKPPADFATNALYLETDRSTLYRNTGSVWTAARALIHECTQAALPSDLGTDDAGFLAWVTDFGHMLEWNGTGWQWGPGEAGNGFIQGFAVAPTAAGWHLCDGTAGVNYLNADGTLSTITVPNLSGSAAYLKMGGAYSGPTIAAATAPTIGNDTDAGGKAASGSTSSLFALNPHIHVATLPADPVANLTVIPYFRQ